MTTDPDGLPSDVRRYEFQSINSLDFKDVSRTLLGFLDDIPVMDEDRFLVSTKAETTVLQSNVSITNLSLLRTFSEFPYFAVFLKNPSS